MPVLLADYLWVICLYASCSFWLAVLIDGVLLPPYDQDKTDRTPSFVLFIEVILQIALRGFLAILLSTLLHNIPSPVSGVLSYNPKSIQGEIIRNPAIISVILFALSKSLQRRLFSLFSRFDKNASK